MVLQVVDEVKQVVMRVYAMLSRDNVDTPECCKDEETVTVRETIALK